MKSWKIEDDIPNAAFLERFEGTEGSKRVYRICRAQCFNNTQKYSISRKFNFTKNKFYAKSYYQKSI